VKSRLLASMLAIAFVCVAILGVPLAILARHQVWTSARERVREQAASVAAGMEDRLDAGKPIDLRGYLRLMPDRRIVVTPALGPAVTAGPTLAGRPVISATVVVADNSITVAAPRAPTIARGREVTAVVIGLALLSTAAAVGLALVQARWLTRPIADLVTRADMLGRGAFTAEPLATGTPEIDRISHVLERSARQIGTLLDLQRDFASDAAHQLRTPLTSIGLHLDELSRIGDGPVREEAEDALTQVGRLDDVITSLLARARGDSAEPDVVDLGALAKDGSAAWERVLARHDRRLRCELAPGVHVLARREHLLGVLASLLDNALAHGDGDVRLSVMQVEDTAVLRVSDDGPGIPADLVSTVFNRRVSGSHGTGIGLALARSLAAAESGSLTISSSRPAEFLLALPAVDAEPKRDINPPGQQQG